MKTGSCPECNSTDVYVGNVRDGNGGLRADSSVYIPASRAALEVETFVCLTCGHVRLFLTEKSRQDAASVLPHDKGWKKV